MARIRHDTPRFDGNDAARALGTRYEGRANSGAAHLRWLVEVVFPPPPACHPFPSLLAGSIGVDRVFGHELSQVMECFISFLSVLNFPLLPLPLANPLCGLEGSPIGWRFERWTLDELPTRAISVSTPPISCKVNCYDNAPMESFFRHLKTKFVYHRRYETRRQAMAEIAPYIDLFLQPPAATFQTRLSFTSRIY